MTALPLLRLTTYRTAALRHGRSLLPALAAGFALIASGAAQADAQCVPQAWGVPALSGAPNFSNAAAGEPNYWPRLDDPRWQGSLLRGFGSGASQTAVFKMLRTGGADAALYLSWYVKVDPTLDPNLDLVRVGFSPGAEADVRLFEIVPFTSAAADETAAEPPGYQVRDIQGGAWTNVTAPAWLKPNTRVWLDKANQQWAINMRVPINADPAQGLNLPAAFKLAFELEVADSVGGNFVFYRFDNAVPLDDLNVAPNYASWTDFNIALSPGSPGCVKGISVAVNDVGTTNPQPNEINLTSANTFFALPQNDSGAAVAAGAISGTFRIANWGSQPDWNDVTDPLNSLWKQINSAPVSNAGLIANGSKAVYSAIPANNTALSFPWTLTAAEKCEFTGGGACPNPAPTRRTHQCMLVELSGAGLSFNPSSVYRNMDFVEASTFEREAEISVAGIAPGGEPQRDVYLYVQKLQMPKSVKEPQAPLALVDYKKVDEILQHGGDGEGEGGESGHGNSNLSSDGGPRQPLGVAHVASDKAPGAVASPTEPKPGRSDTPSDETRPHPPLDGNFEVLNQQFPTYVVHAFRDSGKTVTIGGQVRHVLVPQSSFGYYVHHDGALTGWDTTLQNATEIAPNYYKLSVPEGGSKNVVTRIVAREKDSPLPPPFDKLPWWVWLLLILLVLLILLLRKKP
ncbi:hypothetical protein [Solimonas soli]|uniref:hypothetical protein n=1 Tax=Solimonas soli TaxID=413479 RepID=UPI0004B18A2C|nr:hypothetical protein [Solimonas soli]